MRWQDQLSGKISGRDRMCNEQADLCAGKGCAAACNPTKLWEWLEGQKKRYVGFVRVVHDMMHAILLKMAKLRADPLVRHRLRAEALAKQQSA
eukprot:4206831-Alexandrium_andersonii.AAC.1